ncbi:hypothetical protein [Pedobacter xixiisoli]|uniref:DUF3945 domain-containing protein n=1 Tax=Pedobacter xixiisoli TaxID=1476464 RepID=A0A285ZW61_9SPHI|nr:hypothetical protein [Pedobacter xixiisoli]SOD13870.1 hypothetical protein SAMN06297358_1284 [Pedobacter xixiisoli]
METAEAIIAKIEATGFQLDDVLKERLLEFGTSDRHYLRVNISFDQVEKRLYAEFDIWNTPSKGMVWHMYYLIQPHPAVDLAHFINNGIDSRELEGRFAKQDWSGEMTAEKWGVVDAVSTFTTNYEELTTEYQFRMDDIVETLFSKYLGGTDSESPVIGRIPDYYGLFYKRHYLTSEVTLQQALENIYGSKQVMTPVSKLLEMNINKTNLENLQAEMKVLKFNEALIKEMEKEMGRGRPLFELRAAVMIDKGQMDLTLHFKQSGSSEYYYLNKYELSMTSAKPLEAGRQYFVLSAEKNEKGETPVKSFVNAAEAMEYFKTTPGAKELAVGKTAADKFTLATRDAVKVDYVEKDFKMAYYGTIRTNTFYVDRGKGINVEQGINLMQGRAVFRDDLVNRGTGEAYKAWNTFEFNEAKDKYGNFKVKQYGENYGVDVLKELAGYNIKELADPKKEAEVIAQLKDGHRPVVTVKDAEGVEQQMRIEAMPRYGNFNFYKMDGKMEKREQFQKQNVFSSENEKGKGRDKKADQQQGLSV